MLLSFILLLLFFIIIRGSVCGLMISALNCTSNSLWFVLGQDTLTVPLTTQMYNNGTY